MEYRKTDNGVLVWDFVDSNEGDCSYVQFFDSKVSKVPVIWFGLDDERIEDTFRNRKMYLTQEKAAELLGPLQHFVDTGRLPEPERAISREEIIFSEQILEDFEDPRARTKSTTEEG